jgi:hypothetical protein
MGQGHRLPATPQAGDGNQPYSLIGTNTALTGGAAQFGVHYAFGLTNTVAQMGVNYHF